MQMQDLFLGAGGLIGISASLLGEAVPGHGSAVAVGNAMAMGPPVFHLPQDLVDHVRERAAAGEQAMQHLELDMFRSGASVNAFARSLDMHVRQPLPDPVIGQTQ